MRTLKAGRQSKEELLNLFQEQEFEQMSIGTIRLVNTILHSDIPIHSDAGGFVNMCKAVREIREEISGYSNDKLARFRRDHVGFVFQQNYLNDSMSALDNILVCGLLKWTNRKELTKRAKELLESVDMSENDFRKFPTQLSGGQQQRVAVVRGVINEPEILFADEPTGALNSQNTDNVLNIMSNLNETGQSIVMVTHTFKAAERGNRIIYLADGVISDEIEIGPYLGDYKDETNPNMEEAQDRHYRLKAFLQNMGW